MSNSLWAHSSFFSQWSAGSEKQLHVHSHSYSFSLSTEGLFLVLETLPAYWEIPCIIIGGETGGAGSRLNDIPCASPPSLALFPPAPKHGFTSLLVALQHHKQGNFLQSRSLFRKIFQHAHPSQHFFKKWKQSSLNHITETFVVRDIFPK